MSEEHDPYAEPDLYAIENADYDEDVLWYTQLARAFGGRVLELGCGDGRLTLALARMGVRVRGIDRSAPMLEVLRRRLTREPDEVQERVVVSEGSFLDPLPPGTWPLVLLPFNALHHCAGPDEVVAVLSGARERLERRGVVAVDAYLPDPELHERRKGERYEHRTLIQEGQRVESWEEGWFDPKDRIYHCRYVYIWPGDARRELYLPLRMFERAELHALVRRAGLSLVSEHQDFQGHPMTRTSVKWVVTLERR